MYFGPPPLRAIRHLPGRPARAYDPQSPPGTSLPPGRPARAYDPQPPPGTTPLTGSARQGVRRTAPPGTTPLTGSARQGVRPTAPPGTTPLTRSARQGVRPTAPSGHHTTYRVGPPGRTTLSPLWAPHHSPGQPARAYDPQPPPGTTPLTGSARQGVRPTAPSGHHTTYRVGPPGRMTHSPLRAPHYLPGRPARAYDPQPPPCTTPLTGSARQGVRPTAPSGHTLPPVQLDMYSVRPTVHFSHSVLQAPFFYPRSTHNSFVLIPSACRFLTRSPPLVIKALKKRMPFHPSGPFLTPGGLARPPAPLGHRAIEKGHTLPTATNTTQGHISHCDTHRPMHIAGQ